MSNIKTEMRRLARERVREISEEIAKLEAERAEMERILDAGGKRVHRNSRRPLSERRHQARQVIAEYNGTDFGYEWVEGAEMRYEVTDGWITVRRTNELNVALEEAAGHLPRLHVIDREGAGCVSGCPGDHDD